MSQRFQDQGEQIRDFSGVCLVRCPQCGRRAIVRAAPGTGRARFVCAACGHTRDSGAGARGGAAGVDPYFGLPLWLQTRCAGEHLWAYNAAHLDFLERFVGADLRAAPPGGETPARLRNATLASRLPRWMQSAHNRDAILKCLARLRGTLD